VTIKSVLIAGGSGFLGAQLALKLREQYKVFALYWSHPLKTKGVTYLPCNLDNRDWVKRIVTMVQPDIVIYVAGNHNREWTELNTRDAERLHATGAATVMSTTEIMQPRFIYVSSSYVYDGLRGNYHEVDIALPGNALGKISLAAENGVRGKSLNYILLRSSPVIGRSHGVNLSFLDRIRMALDRKTKLQLNAKETHSFVHIDTLCDLVGRLINSPIKNKVIHCGGLTKVTSLEFGRMFAKKFGYDPELLIPRQGGAQIKAGLSDRSHYDFSLNSSQAIDLLKLKPLLLEESFDLIQKKLISNL
jgi:dTDP-4-dehydrorhamnose reductase